MKAAYYIIRGEGGGGRDGVGDKHVDVNTKSASILLLEFDNARTDTVQLQFCSYMYNAYSCVHCQQDEHFELNKIAEKFLVKNAYFLNGVHINDTCNTYYTFLYLFLICAKKKHFNNMFHGAQNMHKSRT